jgi:HlyD family secretion protein
MKPALPAWTVTLEAEPVVPSMRRTVLTATAAVLIGFGGFFGWAFYANLDGAAVAPGVVVVDSHRKTVSHLEGGILRDLLVKEGDRVTAGQVLLRLDGTLAEATLGQIESQYWGALARTARLRAEQSDLRTLDLPGELTAAATRNPTAAGIIATEQRLFTVRWDTYDGATAIQRKKIAQLREQITALKAQSSATADRLRYTEEELKTVRGLLEKGYERKPRLLELQRLSAELRGRMSELAGNQAQAEQGIAASELEIINLQNTRRSEVSNELVDAQALIADLSERMRGADDIVRRKDVTAPQDGKVTEIRYYTAGSAVAPGSPILDIVPQDDTLLIEAQVTPTDIDTVRVGQPAFVRLSAYKPRKAPSLDGEVIYVSADQTVDPRSGHAFFTTRIRLKPESLAQLDDVKLYPGMPTESYIVSARRRAIDYFLSPITDSLRRAFRED